MAQASVPVAEESSTASHEVHGLGLFTRGEMANFRRVWSKASPMG